MILFTALFAGEFVPHSQTASAQSASSQTRVIELEVIVDVRAAVGTQQEWMQTLAEVGADHLVIKSGTTGTPQIEEIQSARSTHIFVKGSVKKNRLELPGGSFSIRDKAGISALIKKLRDDGATVALAEKKAFGLTSEQLVAVHEMLSKPLNFSTVGLTVTEVIEKTSDLIERELRLPNRLTSDRLADNQTTVIQELNGISAGTAIALVLRSQGLVLQPQRQQGRSLELKIIAVDSNQEFWPVGWPIKQPPIEIEPKIFETLELEIRGFALKDTLTAIENRAGVPFLYDRQAISSAKLDLAEIKVTLVEKKVSYMVAIGRLLRQSKPRLMKELRVDEAGKPFLWITVR